MPEEVLIPTMKRMNENDKKVKIPLVNLALIILCVLLVIGSTFVNVNFQHYILPKGYFNGGNFIKEDFIYSFSIIPQIPVIMFICSAIGKRLATTCIILYFLLGITILPIFAFGGGISYITEYSFGYIFAFIPAVIIAGNILNKKYSFINMFLASLSAVLVIHLIGISYMAILALLKQDGKTFIQGWISAQSGLKVVYDLVLSYIATIIGKIIRSFLKFISD